MSDEKKSLTEDSIENERRVGRRSALTVLGASVVGAIGLTAAAAASPKQAQAQTDSDTGPNADPAGRGRTGRTDSDSGPNADRAGHGRGRSCSDSDSGRYADPAGRGRRC